MNFDELIPTDIGWLKKIAARHPFAVARYNYRATVQYADSQRVDGEALLFNSVLVVIRPCVVIMVTAEGYEHGFRGIPGMAVFNGEIPKFAHRLVRLEELPDDTN